MNGTNDPVEASFRKSTALSGYERLRFAAQASFARELISREPSRSREWGGLVEKASALVAAAAERGDGGALREAVRRAEGIMAPIAPAARAFTVYCVGHAHIDMNWMWSWPETVSVTVDSVTTVLRLMEEQPGFIFSQSQASVYAIMEKYRPDLLEQVKRRVKEGRWEVTASHWVEADKNMASGESLGRHLLYTRRYMEQLFALAPEDVPVEWSPDTFGHAATVPTYLVQGGIRYVYLHRPGAHADGGPAPERPRAFWWAAPDGSRVLVRNDMALGYNGAIGPEMVPRSLVPFWRATGLPMTLFVYGVGDHGGGPTRRDLERLVDMASWPVYPTLRFATAREFFQRLEKEGTNLPVIEGELNVEFAGCFSSQSLIKKANRFAEKRLGSAEVASLFAHRLAAVPYPAREFEQAWRDTLFSHFHDILPGSGVRDTRTFAHGMYQQVVAFTASAQTRALRALAALINTGGANAGEGGARQGTEGEAGARAFLAPTEPGAGVGFGAVDGGSSGYAVGSDGGVHAMVVFNTTEVDRSEIVEATIWDPGWGWETVAPDAVRFDVEHPDGTRTPAQVLAREAYWGHSFQRIAFPLKVPGLGYSRCLVREEVIPATARQTAAEAPAAALPPGAARRTGFVNVCTYSSYERTPDGLENDHLGLSLDMRSGGIRRLTHRPSGAVLIQDCPSIIQYAVERSRTMSAWLIEHEGPITSPVVTKIETLQSGPWVASIAVSMRVASSEMRLTYELRAGDPRLHLFLQVTWLEKGAPEIGTPVLRLALPLAFAAPAMQPRVFYEIPFGAIERAMKHGEEVPALRWAAVEAGAPGKRTACVLFNDSKHGHAFHDGTLCLTLLRSSFAPDPLPEIGQHEVRCALACVPAPFDASSASRAASAFDQELQVVSTTRHGGRLPATAGLVRVEGGVLSGLKAAEDGAGIVMRLYNPVDAEAAVRIEFAEGMGRVAKAQDVDLLERGGTAVTIDGSRINLRIPARGIRSVRVVLAP